MSAEFWAFIGMGLSLALLLYQFIGGLRGEMRGLRGEVGALLWFRIIVGRGWATRSGNLACAGWDMPSVRQSAYLGPSSRRS